MRHFVGAERAYTFFGPWPGVLYVSHIGELKLCSNDDDDDECALIIFHLSLRPCTCNISLFSFPLNNATCASLCVCVYIYQDFIGFVVPRQGPVYALLLPGWHGYNNNREHF